MVFRRPGGLFGAVLFFAVLCSAAPGSFSAGAPAAAAAAPPSLEVGWISREPRLRAPATLDGPRTAGWPEEGSVVQWIGHVLNRGTATVEGVAFSWTVDGVDEKQGVLDLAPGDTELIFPWRWTFERHQIDLAIAPPADEQDIATDDNHVTIDSDALSIAFYVDKSEYAMLPATALGSFERRMQRQIPYWNSVLANAVYPSTPDGALDRIRLDKVIVLPDGAPIPDEDYFDTDLFWRFLASASYFNGRFDGDQTILLHEMMHQRGLVDLYAYEVAHYFSTGIGFGNVNTVDNGKPVVGTFLMPRLPDSRSIGGFYVFESPVDGLMGTQYYRNIATLTEVCAAGLNLWHGRRTPVSRRPIGGGIILGLKDVQPGSYVHRLPSETALTFTDGGAPIAGGVVDVFLDQNGQPYRDTYSADPQLTLPMNSEGAAILPGNVLKNQPPWIQPPKAQTILFRVRTGSARAYVFVAGWELNRLYFRDNGGPSQLQVAVKMIPY